MEDRRLLHHQAGGVQVALIEPTRPYASDATELMAGLTEVHCYGMAAVLERDDD